MMFSREQILSLIESNNELVQTAKNTKKHAEKTGDRWLAEECDKIIINHQKDGNRWLEKLAEHDREIESD
jgi:hypothetical protein